MRRLSLLFLLVLGGVLALPAGVFAYATTTTTTISAGIEAIGYVGGAHQIGQSFWTGLSGVITQADVCVFHDGGTPTDNVNIDLEAMSSGHPSGVSLSSGTLPAASIDTNMTRKTFTMSAYTLGANTQYWLVISRSGDLSAVNFHTDCGDTTGANGLKEQVDLGAGFGSDRDLTISAIVTVDTAGGGGGSSSSGFSGGATSTLEQAQTNLFNGFLVFFISFFGVVWLLRRPRV